MSNKWPYASWLKIMGLLLMLWVCRAYLAGEPSPFPFLNLELPSKSNFIREASRLVFPVVWLGCLASILATPFLSYGLLRVPLALLFLTAWAFNIAVLDLSGASLEVGTRDNQIDSGVLVLFWTQRDRLFEMIYTLPELIPSLVAVVILAVVFAWPPSRKLSARGKWNIIACAPLVVAIAIAVYTLGGTSGFPTPLGLPIRFATAIATGIKQDKAAERFHALPVTVKPVEKHFEKIIVVMDESIRAGFANPDIGEVDLLDFGAAVSVANCSHTSRYLFKRGFRPSELPEALKANGLASEHSTIWQYAKAAGFRTILIDVVGEGVYHDGINSDEISYIDERVYITSRPLYMRDFDALSRLKKMVAQPGRDFIWLDKQGAHHPYQLKYPPDAGAPRSGPSVKIPESEEWREYQRELLDRYNKAVDWSVNKFLSELFASSLPASTLVVYTSDHGQSLGENSTKWPQCSGGAITVDGEGLVPLLLFSTQDSPFTKMLKANASDFKGKYSQFELFPTLLVALGFAPDWVTGSYGASLLDPPSGPRAFLKGGNERRLEWHRID